MPRSEVSIELAHVQPALEIARSADDHGRIINGLSSLAFIHADLGDLDTALQLSAAAESSASASDFPGARIYALLIAGEILRLTGDSGGASARGHEALTMASAVGNESLTLRALRLHGQLLMEGGDVGRGLGTLAFVVDGTASKGGDFTSRIMNPRAWGGGDSRPR